jgi:hypothetical protein
MKVLRFSPAVVLLALAVAAALLAADVRGWQRAFATGDATPGAGWSVPARVPGRAAERLLGVADDVAVRRAISSYRRTVSVHARLDNALAATAGRAAAETALAAIASGAGARASQAATLLGVLAFGDLARGGGRDASQAQTAVGDFESAVRADPSNDIAKLDLELALRALQAKGVRVGPGIGSGTGANGGKGAGSGTPGAGY